MHLYILIILLQITLIAVSKKFNNIDNRWNLYSGHTSEISKDVRPDIVLDACTNNSPAITVTSKIGACPGLWQGHVETAGHLCGRNYKVCSWQDSSLLNQISAEKALNITGCYVFNAAQDGNRCSPCNNDVSSDDLAAIGRHCPQINSGQTGCVPGIRIDASCCVDSLKRQACTYVPGVVTGILCCYDAKAASEHDKMMSDAGRATVIQANHVTGERVVFNCSSVPEAVEERHSSPFIYWFKNEQEIVSSRNQYTWIIALADPKNTGVYTCKKFSTHSRNLETDSEIIIQYNLTVNEVKSSACADGSSEGFHFEQNVRGCSGAWKGHVRRADKQLCGAGWKVCSAKDRFAISQVNKTYTTHFGGCFGYNAAQIKSKCRRCQNKHSMAGLGRDCPVNEPFNAAAKNPKFKNTAQHYLEPQHYRRHSCYENRVIQTYTRKYLKLSGALGCVYNRNQKVSGVLCCRKPAMNSKKPNRFGNEIVPHEMEYPSLEIHPIDADNIVSCYPACRNEGICRQGICKCKEGFFGNACQHGGCHPKCVNDGICLYGYCRCRRPYYGDRCQFISDNNPEANGSSKA